MFFSDKENLLFDLFSYRLSPEYAFPAGLDDSYNVAKYVLEHGDSQKLRIDQNRVALAGDSAGMSLDIRRHLNNSSLCIYSRRQFRCSDCHAFCYSSDW